jgi:molybdopterin/thiamine biosynthesis adenylyltransferase
MTELTDTQLLRYSRQIMLPEVEIDGQQRLLASHALIIGLGGLGSPIALYLAAAGIGTLTLVDHDVVELSNLQRQIVHQQSSIGQPKATSATQTIQGLNPNLIVHSIASKLIGAKLEAAVADADIVLDATDNFETRYELNRICWQQATPLVSGAAIRWEGQISVFDARRNDSPCYQCLYASADGAALNCAENGVIAPLVGIIGTCQALEAIKVLLGLEHSLVGYLLHFDGKRMEWNKFKLPKVSNCPTCSA